MTQPMEPDDELDLRHYLDVLLRRRVALVATAVLVVVVAMVLTFVQTPQYRAEAEVLLRSSTSEEILAGTQVQTNANLISTRVATEIEYMESGLVTSAVEARLGREPDVSIRPAGDTEVVQIRVTSPEPEEAAESAEVYARTYLELRLETQQQQFEAAASRVEEQIDDLQDQIDDLEAPLDAIDAQIVAADEESEREALVAERDELARELDPQRAAAIDRLNRARDQLAALDLQASSIETGGAQLISLPEVPEAPFSPTPLRNAIVAVVVGAILGVGVAFLRETLDDRIRSKVEVERATGWSVIGLVPQLAGWKKTDEARLVTATDPESPAAEAYRTLRTAVQFLGLDRQLQVIAVTSANPGEGKTTTLSNLALSLARTGSRVIVMDGDLRRPRLHQFFGLTNDRGLTSVLLDEADLFSVVGPTADERRLAVLPSGPVPPNPSELLALRATQDLVGRLREQCDVLLIDTPPVLPVGDAAIVSRLVDGVVVVGNARSTRQSHLVRAAELLGQVDAPVLGLVINAIDPDGAAGYGYGYYASDYSTTRSTSDGSVRMAREQPANDIFGPETTSGEGRAVG